MDLDSGHSVSPFSVDRLGRFLGLHSACAAVLGSSHFHWRGVSVSHILLVWHEEDWIS